MNMKAHVPIWALVSVTIADRVATLPMFRLEVNPIVTFLGPSLWILATAVFLFGIVYIWYDLELYEYRIAHIPVGGLTIFTGIVALGNFVILFSLP